MPEYEAVKVADEVEMEEVQISETDEPPRSETDEAPRSETDEAPRSETDENAAADEINVAVTKDAAGYTAVPNHEGGGGDGSSSPGEKQSNKKKIVLMIAAVLIIILIILAIVLPLKLSKSDDEPDDTVFGEIPCLSAGYGPSLTQEKCRKEGCQYDRVRKRCYYPKANPQRTTYVNISGGTYNLEFTNLRNETSQLSFQELTNRSFVLTDRLTNGSDAVADKAYFINTTTKEGDILEFTISSMSSFGRAGYKVIISSASIAVISRPNIKQLFISIPRERIFYNGKWYDDESTVEMVVWNTKSDINLPYFIFADREDLFCSVMIRSNTFPFRFVFEKLGDGHGMMYPTLLTISTVGGELDALFTVGNTFKEVVMETIQLLTADGSYHPPSWATGHMVRYTSDEAMSQLPFDVDVLVHPENMDVSKIAHNYAIPVVYPYKISGRIHDPVIKTAAQQDYEGTIGSTAVKYVDFSAPDNMMDYSETNIYGSDMDGFVLVDNIPLNEKVKCDDNDINTSPYVSFGGGKPLYENTVCPDSLHYGNVPHLKVHNEYGHLQAKLLYTFSQELSDRKRFMASESVALGSNKYTSKLFPIKNSEDLRQLIPVSLWYTILGMSLVPSLQMSFISSDYNLQCLKAISLLPFSIIDDGVIGRMQEYVQFSEIVAFLNLKYSLKPLYYNLLSKKATTLIQKTSFVFPDEMEGYEDFRNDEVDYTGQFMIGDNIIIGSYNAENDKMYVHLPASKEWIRIAGSHPDREHRTNVVIENPKPRDFIYVANSSAVLLGTIENTTKLETSENLDLIVFPSSKNETIIFVKELYFTNRSDVTFSVEFFRSPEDGFDSVTLSTFNQDYSKPVKEKLSSFMLCNVFSVKKVVVDYKDLSDLEYSYNNTSNCVKIQKGIELEKIEKMEILIHYK